MSSLPDRSAKQRDAGAKSADAFRTISEVAEILGVQQHVLRFWETRFNQIKPMKRGGGRRYYRPEDIDLLRVPGIGPKRRLALLKRFGSLKSIRAASP